MQRIFSATPARASLSPHAGLAKTGSGPSSPALHFRAIGPPRRGPVLAAWAGLAWPGLALAWEGSRDPSRPGLAWAWPGVPGTPKTGSGPGLGGSQDPVPAWAGLARARAPGTPKTGSRGPLFQAGKGPNLTPRRGPVLGPFLGSQDPPLKKESKTGQIRVLGPPLSKAD